jgi:hypothetical protein
MTIIRNQARSLPSALVGIALAFALLGCSNAGRYHINLTVDATVDGVKYHGEGVQQYLCHRAYKAMNDLDQCTVLGEAIPLVSSRHDYLFVIMRASNGRDSGEMAAKILSANGQAPYASRNPSLPRQWYLAPEDLPMIVRFADVSNPRSIMLVGETFDPRVSATKIDTVSATAELTDENVTRGRIGQILPWMSDRFYGNKLVGDVGVEVAQKYFFASVISHNMFRAERK